MKSNVNGKFSPPTTGNKNEDKLNVNKFKFIYDKTRKHMYERALREDKDVKELSALLTQTNINSEKIDNRVSKMNTILLNAAKKASFAKRVKNDNKVHKKQHTQDWFTKDCKAILGMLRIGLLKIVRLDKNF